MQHILEIITVIFFNTDPYLLFVCTFCISGFVYLIFCHSIVSIAQYSVLLLFEKVAIPMQYQPSSFVLQYNMASIVHPCLPDNLESCFLAQNIKGNIGFPDHISFLPFFLKLSPKFFYVSFSP